jgi:hypothetical protein
LPAYAPELNPVEGLWNYLKRVELGNFCCTGLTNLGQAFRYGKERVRHKPQALDACIVQCGYRIEPVPPHSSWSMLGAHPDLGSMALP